MVKPDEITNWLGNQNYNFLAGVGHWVSTVLISVLILAAIYAIYLIFIAYKYKVQYYPLRGDPKDPEKTWLGKPKKDYGRFTKVRGVEKFRLLLARKTLKPVDYKFIYPDGIFMIRKSNDSFEPIPRPLLGNPSVTMNLVEADMNLWADAENSRIMLRTTDEDAQKRATIIMISVIIGAFILSGVIIWLVFTFAGGKVDALLGKFDGLGASLGNLGGKAPG